MSSRSSIPHHLHAFKVHPRRLLIQIALFGAVLYIFATQLGSLQASISALAHAESHVVALALLSVCATFAVAAATYSALSGFRHRYLSILHTQVASGFANRLLPAGMGGMSLYIFYYRNNGYTLPAATGLVATNNLLGILANLILVSLVILFNPSLLSQIRLPSFNWLVVFLVVATLACVIVVASHFKGNKVIAFVSDSLTALRRTLRFNHHTLMALLGNMSLTSLNVLTLSLCVLAVHGSLPWTEGLLILSVGTLIGAVVPTPGGIGGVEAGLLAGMAAFGIPSAPALAAVFLFRGLTYWLPILPGFIAFSRLRRKYATHG